MTTLCINITKEVLKATKDCIEECFITDCAISYALREIWPEATTTEYHIRLFGSTKIPHDQISFIKRFDNATPAKRAAMRPFSFEIEVPDEVINEINIDEIRDIIKNSKTLELVKG